MIDQANELNGTIYNAAFLAECPADTAGAQCGDNIQAPWEQCDDGNTVDGDGCSAGCVIE